MASVGLLAARRHHHDGRVDAGAELATDIEPTHPGKHEVEEHAVGRSSSTFVMPDGPSDAIVTTMPRDSRWRR